eukprot:CAMPEP_0174941584 /NCGR_PEP_ID=MMETSP1355-20121228/72124_1 /TAXON_ID=464990 /ORGANISM="Hemiselmis tepida, Strain CCMP443" /LENGTH=65 /DNA_ID=CAMNT_0016188703 /DNA_START=26 /DNA_END=220 /DNA_ORIENTATION=-
MRGDALTGGLGRKAEVRGGQEFRSWMCVRDWSVEEQLACGAGEGEFVCFRFEEGQRRFEAYGEVG